MLINNINFLLKNLPSKPGIYQMFDAHQQVIYVGKAKNLKKRVTSYFKKNKQDAKTTILVQQITSIEVTVTSTENEALLLENILIRKLKPKYNILFKDDKSYPYLLLTKHNFSRLYLYRGPQTVSGHYYGPYPNATAAHETLNILQKIFMLRSCNDVFFRNRKRPCVLHQIKRCSAPCVNYITKEMYQYSIDCVDKFLRGKNKDIIRDLSQKMRESATKLDYENAAHYRDQIANLEKIYEQQHILSSKGEVDAIAVIEYLETVCVQTIVVRNGKVVASKAYFLDNLQLKQTPAEILNIFLAQHYLNITDKKPVPKRIIVNTKITDQHELEKLLSEQSQHKVTIAYNVKAQNRYWLEMAIANAKQSLLAHAAEQNNLEKILSAWKETFNLPAIPKQIECFDISHTMGDATIASCVVFTEHGPRKDLYRKFNITNIAKNDDYAAIEQAIERRYAQHKLPDVIIIDGGKGQLTRAKKILRDQPVTLLAIAKGPSRKPGLETIYLASKEEPITFAADSPILHLLQRIRDEAHRFAITAHRAKQTKTKLTSVLENIPGIGPKKRQKLLQHFGGMQKLKLATIDELAKVPGITRELAERILQALSD